MPFGLSVQVSRFELDLIPAQVHEFGSHQAVPIGHEDHRAVAVTPAVSRSGFHQPLDLSLGEVLAGAQRTVGRPLWPDCSVYGCPLPICFAPVYILLFV